MKIAKIFANITTLSLIIFVAGCAQLNEMSKQRLAAQINSFSDKQMAAAFYQGGAPKSYKFDIEKDYIELEKDIRLKNVAFSHNQAIAGYSNTDYSGDEIASLYIKTARERGNEVRLYKPEINKLIAQKFRLPSMRESIGVGHPEFDYAIIEYNKGRMVSALYRLPVTAQNVTTYFCEQYTRILVGPALRYIENSFSTSKLKDYELELRS